MLAKPEYSSPQDEVCCWPGAMTELLLARGTVAELHREAFAGQGHRGGEPSGSFCWRERCGEGAERPGALWQRSIGKKLLAGRREVCCWPGRYGGASAERRRYGGAFAGRAPRSAERKEGRCVGDPARENPCWVTSVGDPALGNKGVLGASGLYLNQLRGFCFVVPCQSSK